MYKMINRKPDRFDEQYSDLIGHIRYTIEWYDSLLINSENDADEHLIEIKCFKIKKLKNEIRYWYKYVKTFLGGLWIIFISFMII